MSALAQRVKDFWSAGMPAQMDRSVCWVAYSGGLDSTVLLMACIEAGLPVRALHVNHHLQAAAGDMQAHCEQWCVQRGIALDVLHASIERAGGDSLEAQARVARYGLIGRHVGQYATAQPDCSASVPDGQNADCDQSQGTESAGQTATEFKSQIVLTAHHQDDQIETVLLTLFRGSGLEGLAGMAAVSPWPVTGFDSLCLGRPLLGVSRQALTDEASQRGYVWFDDPSNAEMNLRRNWIRLQALPMIRQQFPQVDASMLRLSRQMTQAREEWHEEAGQMFDTCSDAAGGLSREVWMKLSERQQMRVLRHWLAQSGIRLNELRTQELREQLVRPQGGIRRVAPDWAIRVRSGRMSLHWGDDA